MSNRYWKLLWNKGKIENNILDSPNYIIKLDNFGNEIKIIEQFLLFLHCEKDILKMLVIIYPM